MSLIFKLVEPIQEYLIPESREEEKEIIEAEPKLIKKFPIWVVVIIVILGLLLLALIGFAVDKYISHKRILMENQPIRIIERSNEKPQISSDGRTGRSHTPIIKGEEIRVNRYIPNPIIEMSEI